MSRTMWVLLLLSACADDPKDLGGLVETVWNQPLADALVVIDGQTVRAETDENGRFSLPRLDGSHTVKAGRKGYIQEHKTVTVTADNDAVNDVVFKLYPKPEAPGFYAVGVDSYTKLEPQLIEVLGGTSDPVYGMKSHGDARISADDLKIMFHTEFSLREIQKIDLELHKLTYREDAKVSGPLGELSVPVHLYAAGGSVPIEVTPTRSRTDYIVTPKKPLEPGFYAVDYQDLLTPRDRAKWDAQHAATRFAFPFQVR